MTNETTRTTPTTDVTETPTTVEEFARLARDLAHDFNTLLLLVKCNLGFALDALPAGDAVRDDLVEAEAACERATALTARLMALGTAVRPAPTTRPPRTGRRFSIAPTAGVPAHPGQQILVVDDDPSVLKLVKRMLLSDGYDVVAAATAAEGLAHVTTVGADVRLLIVTDVRMPDIDGPTFASQAQSTRPETGVLFMSGYYEERQDTQRLRPHRHFLGKPFSVTELLTLVHTIMDGAEGVAGDPA